MRILSKEELIEKVKISRSFQEFQRNLGYSVSYNTRKRLLKLISKYDINITHFDKNHYSKSQKFPDGTKVCLYCNNEFITKIGNKRERKFCSKHCANSVNTEGRRSAKHREYLSQRLKQPEKPDIIKVCLFCSKEFLVKWKRRLNRKGFCSTSCASKSNWQNPEFVKNHSFKTVKRIKDGKFGWRTRKELSFPEQVYKRFLEENGFTNKFINNHPICKDELNKDAGYYYLDFYFPELKLDLEIDGQQHKKEERISSDILRDISLKNRGYNIFRLEWKQITTQSGKEFLENQKKKLLEFLCAHDVK